MDKLIGTININKSVCIKLTDHGKSIIRRSQWFSVPPEDDDGWSEWQLWCVMEVFGKHITIGSVPPFETDIFIGHFADLQNARTERHIIKSQS